MMMPANYSVIAENELTYVNGGALIDCFAPVMNSSNWKTFNTNLIKIIGNSSMASFLSSTVGVLFSGNLDVDTMFDPLANTYWHGFDSVNNALNTVLSVVGGLAAIYTLGTNDAKTLHNDKIMTVSGKAWA